MTRSVSCVFLSTDGEASADIANLPFWTEAKKWVFPSEARKLTLQWLSDKEAACKGLLGILKKQEVELVRARDLSCELSTNLPVYTSASDELRAEKLHEAAAMKVQVEKNAPDLARLQRCISQIEEALTDSPRP